MACARVGLTSATVSAIKKYTTVQNQQSRVSPSRGHGLGSSHNTSTDYDTSQGSSQGSSHSALQAPSRI